MLEPIFFVSGKAFYVWLEGHHATQTEVIVGFHKKGAGTPSLTWSESVDQALCFGWIDGVRRNHGPDTYTIRFSPRSQPDPADRVGIPDGRVQLGAC